MIEIKLNMRFSTAIACWLATLFSCCPVLAQSDSSSELAGLVDQYIDQRYDGTVADTDRLLEQLKRAEIISLEDLERTLRRPRANYPDASRWLGTTTAHTVQCLHVDYASRYFMYVPTELDLTQSISLVVVGHGGNSSMSPQRAEGTAKAYLQAYRPIAKRMNAVLVAPASCRGWGQIGNSLILSTVSKISRALPIDPNRVYITGQSMGGHLSYRAALTLPDRFGAVSPHSGGYDFVAKQSIGNLINVPGYAIWGAREPYGINADNRTNQAWGQSHGLDWQFVEKDGGHEIYQDELGKVADFFADHPRDLYRRQVYIRSGGTFQFVKTWQIKGWPEHTVYSETKPLRWNMRHWLEVEPRPDLDQPLTVLAVNLGENQFEVTAQNVRKLSIFLHPAMVNLAQPVTIRVNGEKLYDALVETDPRLMFELAREFDDRGRIFWARVDLNVTSDEEVQLSSK